MSDTAPPARYDVPWKVALTHAFRAFMAFFFPELCAQIDWSVRPRFRDKELAGIAMVYGPDSMVADKLVDDDGWRPNTFHNQVLGTVMGISFAAVKLLDFADRTEALMASHNPFALVTLAHLRTQQTGHDADLRYAAKWQLTKLLYQHGWRKQRIIVFFKVINWMMTLPAPQQEVFWRDVLQLGKERKMELNMRRPMEWVTPLEQMFLDKGEARGLEKGLKQGLEQGLEQGRKEGAAALLERLLTRRFGPLPRTARSKLVKASVEQLAAWSDALEEARSLKQLFATATGGQ